MSSRRSQSLALPHIPAEATGAVIVDLAGIAANWKALAALTAPAECGAVVKADAYGLGVSAVVPALWNAGCRTFFVATPDEAHEARCLVPEAVIYALDGVLPGAAIKLLSAGARPVLSSLVEVREWANHAERWPAALHIDTGLNRLGLSQRDFAALMADSHLRARLDITLLMSHLACADEPDHPMNARQLSAFRAARPRFGKASASLAASDGLMLGPDYHFDLVRPGYALYGGQASPLTSAPVRPVVTVLARVLQVRDVGNGESVGYAATYVAGRNRTIATIAAGYADGFARTGSGDGEPGGEIGFRGQSAPVVGRVSMDLITADVTELTEKPVRGDLVELVGPTVSLEAAGKAARTIGYEVLTRLGKRFHRVYANGPHAA